jgi:radical SAM protein with 4Fe4S-binding SPASM domain
LLDKTSIKALPELVALLKTEGFFDHSDFSSHVGSVYDCFNNLPSSEKSNHLTTTEGNRELVAIARKNPEVAELIGIDWHGARFFLQTGQLFQPNYKTCAGATRTFAFDLLGGIYICETTIGKPECQVGTFVPRLNWNEEVMGWFSQRNLLTLDECQSCNQALLCAGGCPFTGQVKGGSLKDLGCRSMKETLEFGLNYYWPQIRQALEVAPPPSTEASCCGSATAGTQSAPTVTGATACCESSSESELRNSSTREQSGRWLPGEDKRLPMMKYGPGGVG